MSRQDFFIQNLVFDIGFFSKDKAVELQNRVSSLFTRSLSGVIQDVCDRTIPAQTLVKADHLVLDIGTVSYGDFENGFSKRLETALLDYFSRFVLYGKAGQQPGTTDEISFAPLADHHLSLFENFLLTGTLPQWATMGGVKELENTILELIRTEPEKVHALVRSSGGNERVRRRLTFQFSESFIERVVHLLQPQEAPFIISYKHNIDSVHRKTPLVTLGADQFHREVWFFILTFLVTESGSQFSRLELAKSTLKRISARFHIDYQLLLQLLKQGIPVTGNDDRQPELIRLIDALSHEEEPYALSAKTSENGIVIAPSYTEENQLPPVIPEEAKDLRENRSNKKPQQLPVTETLDWLVYYFENGSLPLRFAILGRPELAETFVSLIESQPDEVRKTVSRFSPVLIGKRLYYLGGNRLVSLFTGQPAAASLYSSAYTVPGNEPQKALTLQAKEDLLYHFLHTGFLPWWAAQQPVSLQKMMEDIRSGSPRKAVAFLQWAGRKNRYRERLISQFSSGLIIRITSYLPGGTEAAKAFEMMMSVLPDDNRKRSAAFSFIRLLWNNYILYRYRSFSTALFYVQAAKEVGKMCHLPAQRLSFPLKEILEKGNAASLRDLILQGTAKENKPDIQPVIETSAREDEVIRLMLSGESTAGENALANGTGSVSGQPLVSALVTVLHYFFTHQFLPVHIRNQTDAPAGSFAKTSLMLLARISESETEKLLAQFYKHPSARQWLEGRFSGYNYREKQVLQLLNRLMIQEPAEVALQLRTADDFSSHIAEVNDPQLRNTTEQSQSLPELSPNIPLWQRFYGNETVAPEERKQKMMQVLSHFLTWQSLPGGNVSAGEIPVDQVLKEILFFLFALDQSALQRLLSPRATILPEAVIRIAGLFKVEKGGTEQRLTAFLQPALRTAMVDVLWDEGSREKKRKKAKESKPPADILTRLTATGSNTDRAAEQQAAQWLDFFLSGNKLPVELTAAYPSGNREAVLFLALYLSGKNKRLLEQIFQKESHHPAARIRLHEWIQKKEGSRGRELAKLAEAVLQRDILAYLRSAANGLPDAVNSLQVIRNSSLLAQRKKEIIAAVAKYAGAREEWVKTVSAQELYLALKETFPSEPKPYSYLVNAITNLLNPVLQPGYERENLALHTKAFLLMILAGRITIGSPADFIGKFFSYLDARKPTFTSGLYQKLQQVWQPGESMPGEDAPVAKALHKAIAARLPLIPAPTRKKEVKADLIKGKPETTLAMKPADKPHLPEPEKRQPVIEPGTKLYVNNAGLVLMHPFIPTYFMLMGLTEKNEFINEEARQRAVLLLQYMTFGTTEFEEPALVLNKVLCGFPPEEPVPSIIQPTEKERQVTDELFTIVFQRWTRMKNATADGFRHSFLQREGTLVKGEAKWAMRVEPRGYDAILPTMPWAFGFVKLPWMALPVETEWV